MFKRKDKRENVGPTCYLVTSETNQFIFVPKCSKTVNLSQITTSGLSGFMLVTNFQTNKPSVYVHACTDSPKTECPWHCSTSGEGLRLSFLDNPSEPRVSE